MIIVLMMIGLSTELINEEIRVPTFQASALCRSESDADRRLSLKCQYSNFFTVNLASTESATFS